MDMPVVQLECLVGRSRVVVEELAAGGLRRLVGGAVQDEQGQRDLWKCRLESLVRANELRHRLCRLRLVSDERIGIHHGDRPGIPRKVFVLEAQHMRVRKT